MTGGQTVAFDCAALLLLPGGGFLLVGLAESDRGGLVIGVFLLLISGALGWGAYTGKIGRRRLAGNSRDTTP